MSNLGIGAMIMMLGGNEESVKIYQASLNKTISKVYMLPDQEDGSLRIDFTDGSGLYATDSGRSCCESRYMTTDDDLDAFAGAILLKMEILTADTTISEYGEPHEIDFLRITTDRGSFTVQSHNEHNGYYGGICLGLHPVE